MDAWWMGRDVRAGCREPPGGRLYIVPRPPELRRALQEGSCCDQEGRRGSEEAVPGPSVFPSGEPGVSEDFWGSQEGCQGPSRPSGLRYADDTTLMAESEEELKSLLMKVKEESQKAGLKLSI